MAKAKEVTVVNTGVCVLYINRERLLPDEEISISADMIETVAIEYLIARGDLEVKDNTDINKEIKKKAASKRKKDPFEGKTLAQLEDGGEY